MAAALGATLPFAFAATGETVATQTFTNVVTYTIPTVTETVTVTAPTTTTTPTTTTVPVPPPTCNVTFASGTSLAAAKNGTPVGGTGCIHAGTSAGISTTSCPGAMTTIRAYPGETVTVTGSGSLIEAYGGACNLTFSNLNIVETSSSSNQVYMGGTNIVIQDSTITNNNKPTQCVIVGDSTFGVENGGGLYRNTIRNCGTASSNQKHCVYIAVNGSSTFRVSGNTIYGCYVYSIQTKASNVEIDHNTIDGTGSTAGGLLLFGEGSIMATNTNVHDNIIAYAPAFYGLATDGTLGPNNQVHDNCLWQNLPANFEPGGGYTQTNNTIADPLFTNRAAHDYTLQAGSPCAGKGA